MSQVGQQVRQKIGEVNTTRKLTERVALPFFSHLCSIFTTIKKGGKNALRGNCGKTSNFTAIKMKLTNQSLGQQNLTLVVIACWREDSSFTLTGTSNQGHPSACMPEGPSRRARRGWEREGRAREEGGDQGRYVRQGQVCVL